MIKRSGLLAMALLCGLVAGEANAQCGGACGGMGGFGMGGYWDIGRLYSVLAQKVPYYAAFPPVYYSAPVPRSYGYSPFAYPPGTMTPEVVETVSAQEIVNPYVEQTSVEMPAAEEDKVTKSSNAPAPLVVMNPFVDTDVMHTASSK